MYPYKIYKQAWPLVALPLHHVVEWTTQAIHHHLGGCNWVTLHEYSADLVALTLANSMHLHAHNYTYSYTYAMLKALHNHIFP